jgi:hypothetical protein
MLIAGGPPYLLDIIKSKTKHQRATRFIWSMLGSIAFISQIKLHGHWSLIFLGLDFLGSFIVFLLSLKYGVGGWKWPDKLALAIAAVGVIISLLYKQPLLAISGVVLADLSGAILTIIKTFKDPESETTITWLFVGTASLLGALSVGRLELSLLLYPVYLAVGNYSVVIAQVAGRARIKRAV